MGLIKWLFGRRRRSAKQPEQTHGIQDEPVPGMAAESWRAFGASIRGASHERSGLPNQDAIAWWPPPGAGLPLCLAVADGHGSAASFRSDTGSRLAVETAIEVLRELIDGWQPAGDLSAAKRAVEDELPRALVQRWRRAVQLHADTHPIQEGELSRLEEHERAKWAARQEDPLSAYGSTLLAVVIHESFLACLQLGDGDILVVTQTGQTGRPVADDPRLFANETTSLSGEEAWRDVRSHFQVFSHTPPSLVLACTDGYANSFKSDEGFLRVGADVWDLLSSEGLEHVKENLPLWLEEASRQGSGDDVTAGVLCCTGALKSSSDPPGDPGEDEGTADAVKPASCDRQLEPKGRDV